LEGIAMNMLNFGLAVLLLAGPTAAAESPPYRWLNTSELEALLRGSRIVEADNMPSYMKTPEDFHQNGRHVRYADNYEGHGKYSFRDSAVCDQEIGGQEVCRRILIDKQGRYWIVSRDDPRLLVKISVKPLR
jgi:hypothetical protein